VKISRIAQVGAVAAIAALALAGCASNENGGGSPEPTDDAPTTLAGNLVGVGASAQEVAIQAWTTGFQVANPDVTVDYDPAGSGTGREAFQAGASDFAGSDRAFRTSEIADGEFAGCVDGSSIIQLPTYISPIAVVFNLEGIDSLNLDAATIAGIFAGEITTWDDAAIAESNADVELPATAITPVHRSDNSGTTENFTDYLHATSPDVWTFDPHGDWPIDSGEAAQGTSGVVSAVSGGQGTIGYVDASRAGELGTVAVQVGDEFVEFTPEAAAAAVEASPFEEGREAGDLAVALDRTTTAAGVYPIVLISYLIACGEYADSAKVDLLKGFLSHAASAEGQAESAASAGNAPISDGLRQQVQAAIDSIS